MFHVELSTLGRGLRAPVFHVEHVVGSEQRPLAGNAIASRELLGTWLGLLEDLERRRVGRAVLGNQTERAQGIGRPSVGTLGRFAHHQKAANLQQGSGALRRRGRSGEAAGHDGIGGPAEVAPAQRLGATLDHSGMELERPYSLLQKSAPLGGGIDQHDVEIRPGRREDKAGHASPAPQIDQSTLHPRHGVEKPLRMG